MNSSTNSCPKTRWYILPPLSPVGYLAIGTMLGIISQQALGLLSTLLIILCVGLPLFIKRSIVPAIARVFVYALIGGTVLGAGRMAWSEKKNTLPVSHKDTIDIKAHVLEREETDVPPWKMRITLHVNKFRINKAEKRWHPAHFTMRTYLASPCDIHIDDQIVAYQLPVSIPQEGSIKLYFARERVETTSFTYRLRYYCITRPTYSLRRMLYLRRNKLFDSLSKRMSIYNFSLFASLFAGNKKTNINEFNATATEFRRWGIVHYLARSGLHMATLALLWKVIFRWIPAPWRMRIFLQMLAIAVYALLSWSSVSFIRALIVLAGTNFYDALKIPSNLLQILSVACLLMLLVNPYLIFFIDFQLTFLLTCALVIFNRACANALPTK